MWECLLSVEAQHTINRDKLNTQRWGVRGGHTLQESKADTAIMSKSPTRGQRQVWRTRAARSSSVFSRSITVSAFTQHLSGRGTILPCVVCPRPGCLAPQGSFPVPL